MIKKIITLGIAIFGASLFVTNVNAAHVNDGTEINGHYQQTFIDDAGKSYAYYCIDKAKGSPDFSSQIKGIYKITSTDIDRIYNNYGRDYNRTEYALRLWASRVGLTTTADSKRNEPNYDPNGETTRFINSLSGSFQKIAVSTSGITATLATKTQSGTSVTATFNLSATDESIFNRISNWSSATSGWTIVSQSVDHKTVTVTGNIVECEGKKVTLSAKTNGSNNPGTTTGPDQWIYIEPVNKATQQGGLIHGPIPYVDFNPGSSKPGTSTSGKGTTVDLSIPDDECKCDGSSNLCEECQENGKSADNETNIKSCANSGKFQKYCDLSLKKSDDINKDTTQIASNAGNVTPSTKLSTNQFCSVYCLEEIEYNMPGALKTKNGRYFTLTKGFDLGKYEDGENIGITGTRKCVTSEIKTELYKEKIESAQRKVFYAYNKYQVDKKYNEALESAQSHTETIDGCNSYKNGKCVNSCNYTKHTQNGDFIYTHQVPNFDANKSVTISDGTKYDPNIEYYTDSDCDEITNTDPAPEKRVLDEASIQAALVEMYELINEYKSCFEWTNNYCFEPKAEFSYDEAYTEMNGELATESDTKGSQQATYYSNVNEQYEGLGTGYNTLDVNYVYANTTQINNSNRSKVDMTSKYVKKEVTNSRKFKKSTKVIYSYHPYGTIVTNRADCTGKDGNCVEIGYAIPVALEHEDITGNYQYNIKFSNVGVRGDDATCHSDDNRINGNDGCSLTPSESNCTTDYSCKYTTTCDNCTIECKCPDDDPNCEEENRGEQKICKWVSCPTCTVTCVGCIWNGGDTTYSYKTVGLSDVFPNKETTDVGYNWNTNGEVNPNAEKAEATIKEIETNKNKAYNKPDYEYKLTPSVMAKIRQYNEKSNSGDQSSDNIPKGGYNNNTLTCNNGSECKSSFLDLDWIKQDAEKVRNDKWYSYNDGKAWK